MPEKARTKPEADKNSACSGMTRKACAARHGIVMPFKILFHLVRWAEKVKKMPKKCINWPKSAKNSQKTVINGRFYLKSAKKWLAGRFFIE